MSSSSYRSSCSRVLNNQDTSTSYSSGLYKHHTEVVGGTGWTGEFSLTHENSQSFKKWLNSLKFRPDIVSYSLRPMYELVRNKTQKAAIQAAIKQYLQQHAQSKSPSEPKCGYYTDNIARNCCPKKTRRGRLEITLIRAWNLYGDYTTVTDSYAIIRYGSYELKTSMIESNDPRWKTVYNVGKVDTHLLLEMEVWDEDLQYDDLLISCTRYITQGSRTYTCTSGTSGFEVYATLTCDPYLTGDKCDRYKSSPR